MALKKSDLYGSLWRSCDELRGGMDASQYKDYILTLLFVKYVTDKAKTDHSSLIDVPAGGSFDDMVALKGDKEIGDKINKIIARLAEANGLEKVIDLADFNDEEKLGRGKEMIDRLSKLVTIFADMDFRGSRAEGDDLLGDAYEYLMRHFATESGKSKGQFYTPAEVSRILAKVVGIGPDTRQDETVYDPTCGSGSLLLKVAAEAPRGITIYGQEKDNATWALSKMNMILHGSEDADIRKGDTITSPQFTHGGELRTFDFAVANPPFSIKSWSNGLENDYGRFEFGRPPEKNGDYAFLLHILKSLKSTGKAAVILPHGVLFHGNAEASIRKHLLRRGYIRGIIGLPVNLFYGTGIPACVIVLDKENAQGRTGVFMIDASKGFIKDGNKNRLRAQDIHKVVDVFTRQTELERYSRMVPLAEIAGQKNDYNLNIPRYIDSSEPEDIQDLHAHLHGGIPDRDVDALSTYWDAFPSLRSALFKPNRPGYSHLAVDVQDVQQTILDSDEFTKFAADVRGTVDDWFATHRPILQGVNERTVPRDLIARVGDDLLARFKTTPLLDEYDVYERFMTYWNAVMHDDVFLVMNEGWMDAAMPRKAIQDKERGLSETPDLVVGSGRSATKYKMDLVPPTLIVARFLSEAQAKVDELAAAADEAARGVEEYTEEHGVEDGPLAAAMEDGRITKGLAAARLRDAKREKAEPEEIKGLQHLIDLYTTETTATKAAKDAQAALDLATLEMYGELNMRDIKQLVLDDKWHATVASRIADEVSSLTLHLVERIQQLGDRYAETVSDLEAELAKHFFQSDDFKRQIDEHLGATINQVTNGSLNNFIVALPGETERNEIASRLSDADHLIAKLDRLSAKKQAIRRGVVQQLLTGKMRLPGFEAPWVDLRLGDHVTYVKAVPLSRAQLDTTSPLRYLHYGDIHTSSAVFLAAGEVPMPRAAQTLAGSAGHLQVGDLVFADASEDPDGVGRSVEVTSVPPEGVVPGLHTIATRFDKSVLADRFKGYLQFIPAFREALLRVAAGTKVLATTRVYISSISLSLPCVDEQRAIAEVLADVDGELDTLRDRLAKAKAVKQGMMQELLTGRTRLPVEEAADG